MSCSNCNRPESCTRNICCSQCEDYYNCPYGVPCENCKPNIADDVVTKENG